MEIRWLGEVCSALPSSILKDRVRIRVLPRPTGSKLAQILWHYCNGLSIFSPLHIMEHIASFSRPHLKGRVTNGFDASLWTTWVFRRSSAAYGRDETLGRTGAA